MLHLNKKTLRSMTNRKEAFTLIELLVVIAIIAILAAILFPVFAQAREKARQASDTSNLKQIGLGFLQYQQDYDEYFPPSVTERYSPSSDYTQYGSSTNASGWVDTQAEAAQFSIRGILDPYIKSSGIWHDPSQIAQWSDPTVTAAVSGTTSIDGIAGDPTAWYSSDYGFNFDESVWDLTGRSTWPSGVDGYGGTSAQAPTSGDVPDSGLFEGSGPFVGDGFNGLVNLAKITSPGTFILGADSARNGKASRGSLTPNGALLSNEKTLYSAITATTTNWPPIASSSWNYDPTQASIALRHSNKANFLFGDGHVKLLAPEQVYYVSGGVTTNYFARTQ